jgi:hypothetical protein
MKCLFVSLLFVLASSGCHIFLDPLTHQAHLYLPGFQPADTQISNSDSYLEEVDNESASTLDVKDNNVRPSFVGSQNIITNE